MIKFQYKFYETIIHGPSTKLSYENVRNGFTNKQAAQGLRRTIISSKMEISVRESARAKQNKLYLKFKILKNFISKIIVNII